MKKLITLTVLVMVLLNGTTVRAQEPKADKKLPELYGHTFPSLSYFRSSFVNTSLQANLGFGMTSTLSIPGIIIDDIEILSFEGQMLFFDMKVKYQQRFTPWLALYFSFNTAGRIGTDMSTIMADGVNTLNGGTIGWLVRIRKTERFNLSGTLNLTNLTGNFINVSEYFRDLINNNPDPSLTKKIPAMAMGVGLLGAYAFSPSFGMQFSGEYAYGESFELEENDGYFSAGIMGDYDFYPKQNVPVGLALGYTLTTAPEVVLSDGGLSNLAVLKLGYTGSDDFELGLQYSVFNVRIQSVEEKPFVNKFMLMLKFYF